MLEDIPIISSLISAGIGFLTALSMGVGKFSSFMIVQSVMKHKIETTEQEIEEIKSSQIRLEDKLTKQLERIERKLDVVILKNQ